MNHASHAAHTEMFRAAPLALMRNADHAIAAANLDDDWEEFLSLGMQADVADLGTDAGGWERTPVLLSY